MRQLGGQNLPRINVPGLSDYLATYNPTLLKEIQAKT